MKPIVSSSYRLVSWKKLAGLATSLLLLATFIITFSIYMKKVPSQAPSDPKMKIETIVMVEKVPYGMCHLHQPSQKMLCEAWKDITTYRYEEMNNGDLILRDDFIVSHIFVGGYVDDCGTFYQAPSPTYNIVYPTIKIRPSFAPTPNYRRRGTGFAN